MKTYTVCLTSKEVSVINRILSVEGYGTIEITDNVDCYRLTDVMILSIIRLSYIHSYLLNEDELVRVLSFCADAASVMCSKACVNKSNKLILK